MNLGELKASLSRMSPDLDDCEVVVLMLDDKKKEFYDTLGFTAYVNVKDRENPIFLMGSHDSAVKMMKEDRLHYPDGSVPDLDDTL